ncbi:MAG: C40 family peptidase, partial [Candidatus Adiutrix sp.]|nr:C40 family peptidase [Candidatus Adiutrix sp.]
ARARLAGFQAAQSSPSASGILKTAFSKVGLPYRYGGTSPQTGFDCSGFVGWVYGQHHISLPRSSPEMMALGQAVDRRRLEPGDLVFFGRKNRVTHVGIYTGGNRYIHSPSRGKSIRESGLDDRARGEYYVGARRLLPNLDLDLPNLDLAGLDSAAAPPAAGAPDQPGDPPTAPPSPSPKPPQVAAKPKPPQDAAKKHKVKAGDTLYDLARKYSVTTEALAKANRLDKKKPAHLRLGQVLLVPAKARQ